jgi:acetoacetate decarboxylase
VIGTLDYAGERVATGTMAYKHDEVRDKGAVLAAMTRQQINLKLIPHVDGSPAICQLVGYELTDITLKGAWTSPARLHLVPHANAPVADLPVREVVSGTHYIADLTLPFGRVLHDYLA